MRKWVLFIFGLCAIPPQFTSIEASELQQGYMVWDKTCITEVYVKEGTYIDAPFENGVPDMKRAVVHGIGVTFNKDCGRIEIRRKP